MTYTIQKDRAAITCHFCHKTSYNKNDVEQLYCGHCKIFHADHPPSPELTQARKRLAEEISGMSESKWEQ